MPIVKRVYGASLNADHSTSGPDFRGGKRARNRILKMTAKLRATKAMHLTAQGKPNNVSTGQIKDQSLSKLTNYWNEVLNHCRKYQRPGASTSSRQTNRKNSPLAEVRSDQSESGHIDDTHAHTRTKPLSEEDLPISRTKACHKGAQDKKYAPQEDSLPSQAGVRSSPGKSANAKEEEYLCAPDPGNV